MKRTTKVFLTLLTAVASSGVLLVTFLVFSGLNSEKFPVMLPGKYVSTGNWDQWVIASGTWTIDNSKPGAPFQTSEIHCDRQKRECEFVTAEVMLNTLRVSSDKYTVRKWDATEIVAASDLPACFRYVYSLNRLTEQVTGMRIRKPLSEKNSALCGKFSDESLQLRLIDGSKWYWEEWNKAQPSIVTLLLPALIFLFGGLYFVWRPRSENN